jgi:hypothetical protein
MRKYLVIVTQAAGVARINRKTGRIRWEQKNLDPALRRYTRKYLVREGFVEQALGILDPELDERADLFLDDDLELQG